MVFLCFFYLINTFSQEVIWNGNAADNDFFNELNWENTSTNTALAPETLKFNIPINLDLKIENENQLIISNGIINLGTGSLTITKATIDANAISGGSLIINTAGYIDFDNTNPIQGNTSIELNSGIGWVRTENLTGELILNNHINQIKVNQQTAVYKTNLRLDNYYLQGTVIRSNNANTAPLTIYDTTNLSGNSTTLNIDVVHSENSISNNMNNKTNSFLLKKGFMATFADENNGTGKSKNYIALEQDLIINELPEYLQNNISFIRVVPWNWVAKKGIGGNITGLDESWFYNWGNSGISSLEREYVPMAWGAGGADNDSDITKYKSKHNATHVLAFNESDNCNDQSGQFNNLCQTDVAVGFYKNLMKTGLRLVSPSGRENAPFGWLKEFHEKATAQDIRIDVIGVHWYDWGANPQGTPNENATRVFDRFKTYLKDVYDLYKLPIWITEFNANPNRTNAVNLAFMKLALPYLENLDYVERYAWFQPVSDVADYFDSSNNLTNVGAFYKNQNSTPAIPENTVKNDNNLDIYYRENAFQLNNLLTNGDFETGDLIGWSGSSAIDVLKNDQVYEGETSGRLKAGQGNMYQEVSVEASSKYDLSFYTKWFVAPSSAIEIQILNSVNDEKIASKMMTADINWNLVEFSFDIPANVTSIKIYVEKEDASPGWFIDYAFLKKNNSILNIDNFDVKNDFKVYPNPSKGNIKIESSESIASYMLYNLQGQIIQYERNINQLKKEINVFHKGIYFLKIKNKLGKSSFQKIVIH
jgi:hypothetical protein